MCQIVCKVCNQPAGEDEILYQVRLGFIEGGEFIPEEEIACYHVKCYPLRENNPDETLIIKY